MEAIVTAAANIEIFLATLAIAALLARLSLRGLFRLMRDAGAGAGRHFTVQHGAGPAHGSLSLASARAGNGQGRMPVR
jgi:hypothetical protein